MSQEEPKLTDKQRVFLERYLTHWNGARAAREAGYPEETARQIAAENLSKPYIASRVRARMDEVAMSADETLVRLGEQARGNLNDFYDIGEDGLPRLNLKKAEDAGVMHLVKEVVFDKFGSPVGVVLHDASAALVNIGRHHKLFTDKTEAMNDGEIKIRVEYANADTDLA